MEKTAACNGCILDRSGNPRALQGRSESQIDYWSSSTFLIRSEPLARKKSSFGVFYRALRQWSVFGVAKASRELGGKPEIVRSNPDKLAREDDARTKISRRLEYSGDFSLTEKREGVKTPDRDFGELSPGQKRLRVMLSM